jgi:hypothetical protein
MHSLYVSLHTPFSNRVAFAKALQRASRATATAGARLAPETRTPCHPDHDSPLLGDGLELRVAPRRDLGAQTSEEAELANGRPESGVS